MKLIRVLGRGAIVTVCLLLGLFAIERANEDGQAPEIEEGLGEFVNSWRQDCYDHDLTFVEDFNDLDQIVFSTTMSEAGQSDKAGHEIRISTNLNYMQTKSTVYHELGHYVFGLDHSDEGIMRDEIYPEQYYIDNWQNLYENYFFKIVKSQ